MRRITFALLFAILTLSVYAQDVIKVNYKGARPTVSDFARAAFAVFNADDDEPGDRPWKSVENAMKQRSKGIPQEEGETLTIDTKNGYILYELAGNEDEDYINRMEVCYWNEADGKHKLVAFNNLASFVEGRPLLTETSDLIFYRYNNATKKMTRINAPGFKVNYGATYALPRNGKNITVTTWDENGTPTKKTLKWNGRGFSY